MYMPRKKKEPSNNFCVICGRYTNKKRYGEDWSNYFYFCNNCEKVWCAKCFGQISGKGPNKTFKLGKKGQIYCPDCGKTAPVVKNPVNLQFIQTSVQAGTQSQGGQKVCPLCNQKIRQDAKYCDFCGEAQ